MYYSKNNIVVKIDNTFPVEYAILNPLSGNFDILEKEEYDQLNNIQQTGTIDKHNKGFINHLFERGYLFEDKADEDRSVKRQLANFMEE